MPKRRYDSWELDQIHSHIEDDPILAKERFERYLRKYPMDYTTYPYYANTLLVLGLDEDAEKAIKYGESLALSNDHFMHIRGVSGTFIGSLHFAKIKLLAYREQYFELYNYIHTYKHELGKFDYSQVNFLCLKKLGMLENKNREKCSYLSRQIIKYDHADFLDHMKKHLNLLPGDYLSERGTFSYEISLNILLNEIKKYMPSDKKIFTGVVDDTYTFRLDNCGKYNGKNANYFTVVVFHNTTDIISMYPTTDNAKNLPHVDLNYLWEQLVPTNSKVRKRSQIDKFNARYNIK